MINEHKQHLYRIRRNDFILAGMIVLLSFAPLFVLKGAVAGGTGKALVYVDGTLLCQIDMSRDQVVEIAHLKIEVKEAKIRITDADCPQKICERTGWISAPAHTIVCAPNKVLVEIEGESGQAGYDALAY